MKGHLIFLILFILSFNSFCQYTIPGKSDCEILKDRILAIELFEEKDEVDKNINEYYKEASCNI